MAVVKLEHVGKRYDGGAPVISDVSLTLEAGGFYLLTGASGSGKTTLLRLITLAERPTHGRLTLFGADTAALDRTARAALRRRIGIVFEDLLAWVGMAGRADAPTATLSGGERQRVAIARAIVGRPELLIADEPTGAGGEIALLLVGIFEQMHRLGTTVLIATDDIAFARRFKHRRFHLDHGMLSDAGAAAAAQ